MTSAFVLGVDTNVLVRFLADDDDVQTPLAAKIITNPSNQPIFIGIVVLTETYTVLTRVKKFPPAQVIAAMRMMLSSTQFRVEAADIVRQALDDAEEVGCGLTDSVIALQNAAKGCETTATFDKRAQRLHAMVAAEDRV